MSVFRSQATKYSDFDWLKKYRDLPGIVYNVRLLLIGLKYTDLYSLLSQKIEPRVVSLEKVILGGSVQ